MPLRRALGILIVSSALLRLFSACYLGLGNDEAYHSLYAAHPALGYYDHPPMMAWIEMLGLSLPGRGASAWALRIGFIVMFAGSTWLLARLTARFYGERAGFVAALALNLTGYYGLAASTFALPDGPLLFFWLLSPICTKRIRAVVRPVACASPPPYEGGARGARRANRLPILPWLWVGLAWGGAMLSKYHGIFLPWVPRLYLLLHRPARRWLRQPGPYLAMLVAPARLQPGDRLERDARLGFVSLSGRACRRRARRSALTGCCWPCSPRRCICSRGSGCRCRHPVRRLPQLAAHGEHDRLLLALAVAPLCVFTLVACFRPVLPHWGLIGLVSLFPLWGANGRRGWRLARGRPGGFSPPAPRFPCCFWRSRSWSIAMECFSAVATDAAA